MYQSKKSGVMTSYYACVFESTVGLGSVFFTPLFYRASPYAPRLPLVYAWFVFTADGPDDRWFWFFLAFLRAAAFRCAVCTASPCR
jgi:hypothetical protein